MSSAATPRQDPLAELITAAESAIRKNITDPEAEQLQVNVSVCLGNAKSPPTNIGRDVRNAPTTLSKDNNIIILSLDKGFLKEFRYVWHEKKEDKVSNKRGGSLDITDQRDAGTLRLIHPNPSDEASLDQSCTLSVSKSWQNNFTIPRLSTKNKSAVCSPKVNIMFMKTHKTASSTLLNILFRFGEKNKLKFAFPNGRNDFFYPSPFLCSQVKDYRPGECFNIVCNHMRFNAQEVAKLLPLDTVYITILRDPADLFESSFHYYHRAVPLTWRISGEDKMTEFLRSPWTYYSPEAYNSFYLRNLLFFDFGFDNNLEADDSFVVRAIQTLSEHFHLILIAEYFEESLVLLKETLCWTIEDLLFFKFNVRQRSQVSRLTPELRAKALNWNGADWRLYKHFNSTFWTRVHTFGEKRMEQEVKELRRRISEMKAICIEGESAVEAKFIQNKNLLPWQPVGESSVLGYNMKKDIDPKYRTLCRKMLTPEIQYLSDLGVSLWLTRLWGWLKSAIY